MYQFKKILVALDHTDIDQELIEAASLVARLSEIQSVKFIHIIKNLDPPAAIKKEFPNLMEGALEERQKEIQRKVDQYYSGDKSCVEVEIKSGQRTKSILKYSANKAIDLLIVGRKNEKKAGGVIIHRLARRAGCSMLIIPKGYKKTISKIVVPVDFSDHSMDAVNQTIDLLKLDHYPKPSIFIQHVYQVPSGYHYTGKSFDEFSEIMRKHAEKDYHRFMCKAHENTLDIQPIFTLDRHDDIIEKIYQTATAFHAGAIVIGAKGVSATASLFIGSIAEKLVSIQSAIPILVVRPKDKQKGIIDYLKKI